MRLWLEDKLRPPLPADPWSRDVLSIALLLILASVLLPAWHIARDNFLPMVAANMASILVLPALGFLLVLRCGAIDLSVWVVSGIGGMVAASLISRGCGVPLGFAAGLAAGLGIGLANAALVALPGLPSPVVTLATGMAGVWIAGSMLPGRDVQIPDWVFSGVVAWHSAPLLAARVLAVAIVYASALAGLMAVDVAVWRGVVFPRRVCLFAALAASGLLSAAGGVFWLFENTRAPVPTRLIDDLRIPAAAILAGGLFLGRKGRELLAGMNLPAALLICTIWRQEAWHLPAPGYGLALQMLVLTGMTLGVHLAFGRYLDAAGGGRFLPKVSVLLTVAGIALVGAAANFRAWPWHDAFHGVGVAVWLAGMPTVIAAMRRERQPATAHE